MEGLLDVTVQNSPFSSLNWEVLKEKFNTYRKIRQSKTSDTIKRYSETYDLYLLKLRRVSREVFEGSPIFESMGTQYSDFSLRPFSLPSDSHETCGSEGSLRPTLRPTSRWVPLNESSHPVRPPFGPPNSVRGRRSDVEAYEVDVYPHRDFVLCHKGHV